MTELLKLIKKPAPWIGKDAEHTVVDLPKHVLQQIPRKIPGWDDMIYWTTNATYCMIEGDQWQHPEHGPVSLISINGGGEIRWRVGTCTNGDDRLAIAAFKLTEKKDIDYDGIAIRLEICRVWRRSLDDLKGGQLTAAGVDVDRE